MAEDPGYVGVWRRYRTLARLRWVAWLGYLPFGAAVGELSQRLGVRSDAPLLFIVPWFLFLAVTTWGALNLRCPRCGGRFFYTWSNSNPFSSRCRHCNLPKWATHDPDEDA